MATLLEKLKQGLGQVGAPAGPVESETEQVTRLAAAKAGVTGPLTGLSAPSLPELAAKQATQESLGQLAEQAETQQASTIQGFQEQEQKLAEAKSDIESQRRGSSLQARIKTENILRELEQKGAALDEQARGARLEQAAALLRNQTQDYVERLAVQGDKDRLSDAIKFNEALANDIMKENLALATLRIGNQEARDVSDREFEKMLTAMSASDALAAYRASLRAEQTQGAISGASTVAKSSLEMYGASQSGTYDKGYQDYKNELGPNEKGMSYSQWQKSEQSPTFVGPKR
jgi:hypothetical protein